MLRIANDIAYRTDGIFDVVAAGTGGAAEWTDLDLSLPGAIRMRKKLRLSLGGLARGFAVDLAVQALKEMGAGAGLVDIGGCIRAFGQRAWRVDYGTTYDLATASTSPGIPVVVHDSAIAGIGSMFDRVTLVDPHRKQVSSTQGWVDHNLLVRAKSCAVADALTKVSALNMEESTQLLMPFGADAITLSRTGAEPLKQMH
jgi:thiamine biosynthesis lipoprotein